MKVKRNKDARRHLRFFRASYGLFAPYNVLIDGNVFANCAKCEVSIREALERLLGSDRLNLYTTGAALDELTVVAKGVGGHFEEAIRIARKECRVVKSDASDPAAAIMAAIEHDRGLVEKDGVRRRRYLVLTMDADLRVSLRRTPGTPVLLMNRNALVMEPPSTISKMHAAEKAKDEVEEDGEGGGEGVAVEVGKKRKRRKSTPQPNPLSVKKKKKEKEESAGTEKKKKKTRRKRNRGKEGGGGGGEGE